MRGVRIPAILAMGRWHSSDELDAIARGWRAAVLDTVGDRVPLMAAALPTSPEGVALLAALSSLPPYLLVLPPDTRAWRSEPPIPPGTPIVLPARLASLVPDARKLGLDPFVVPEASTRAEGESFEPFAGAAGFIQLTSGSTGPPRPVCFPLARYFEGVHKRVRALGLPPGRGIALCGSPAYGQGLRYLLTAVLLEGPLAVLDPHDHRLALTALADPRLGCWRATPHLVHALIQCTLTGPPIVPPMCILGTPVVPAVFEAFLARFGVPLRQGYSSTEMGPIALDNSPADRVRPGTVGRPMQGTELRIGDHPDRPLAPDETGRIWVRGPGHMEGYGFPPNIERPADTDGWRPTQDLGRLDPDGYLVLAGRTDEAVRTRDNRTLNLAHVAASMQALDGVGDVVVVRIDTAAGTSFGAVVEGDAGLTLEALRSRIREALPPWSWPRAIELVSALPRLPNGKADRQACARRLAAGTTP